MASGHNYNPVSSYLHIFAGVGFGLVSHRLWIGANSCLAEAAGFNAQLASAKTIPLSSLKNHSLCFDGHLVIIQNGVVQPIGDPLISSSGHESVIVKTVKYTDQPAGFQQAYKGTYDVDVSRVPFALVDSDGSDSRGVVVKADVDYLPLKHESTKESPLNRAIFISKIKRYSTNDAKKGFPKEILEVREEIQVKMVTDQSVLRAGTVVDNVFGRFRVSDGGNKLPTIEPCPEFPKEYFTMGRSEIKKTVDDKAEADAFTWAAWSVGAGFVAFGLTLSGFNW